MTQRQLTDDQAQALREERATGVLGRALAAKYGVSLDMVYDIVHGKTYQDVGGPTCVPKSKLSPADVVAIRQAHARGVSQESLAAQYGIARMTVWDAVTGVTWTKVGGPLAQHPYRLPVPSGESPPELDEIAIERALEDIVCDVRLSVRLTEAERDAVIRLVPMGRRQVAQARLKVSWTTWGRVMAGAA
jgi:predicted DNA-binding protein (UPF0251 family)